MENITTLLSVVGNDIDIDVSGKALRVRRGGTYRTWLIGPLTQHTDKMYVRIRGADTIKHVRTPWIQTQHSGRERDVQASWFFFGTGDTLQIEMGSSCHSEEIGSAYRSVLSFQMVSDL